MKNYEKVKNHHTLSIRMTKSIQKWENAVYECTKVYK